MAKIGGTIEELAARELTEEEKRALMENPALYAAYLKHIKNIQRDKERGNSYRNRQPDQPAPAGTAPAPYEPSELDKQNRAAAQTGGLAEMPAGKEPPAQAQAQIPAEWGKLPGPGSRAPAGTAPAPSELDKQNRAAAQTGGLAEMLTGKEPPARTAGNKYTRSLANRQKAVTAQESAARVEEGRVRTEQMTAAQKAAEDAEKAEKQRQSQEKTKDALDKIGNAAMNALTAGAWNRRIQHRDPDPKPWIDAAERVNEKAAGYQGDWNHLTGPDQAPGESGPHSRSGSTPPGTPKRRRG